MRCISLIDLLVLGAALAACGDDSTTSTGSDLGDSGDDASIDSPVGDIGDGGGTPDGGGDLGVGGPGTWIELPLPDLGDRQEQGVVALDGEVVMVGGFAGNGAMVETVEAYDPVSSTWRRLADMPAAMHHPNAVVFEGRLMVVGYLGNVFIEQDGIFEYDAAEDEWMEHDPIPAGRAVGSSGTVVLGDRIVLVGGFRSFAATTAVSAYDPDTGDWADLADLPDPRDHMSAVVLNGEILVAGGRDTSIGAHTNSLIAYDPVEDEWSQRAPMITSRGGHAGAVFQGRYFIFGGEGNPDHASGVFDQAEVYDPDSDSWTPLTPMAVRRHGTNAAALEDVGMIVVPMGGDMQSFGHVSRVDAWVPGPATPSR